MMFYSLRPKGEEKIFMKGEDNVASIVKQDGASSEKHRQKFDMLQLSICRGGEFNEQATYYFDGGNVGYSTNIGFHMG